MEQKSIYIHYDGNQSNLANKQEAQQQTLAKPNKLQINQKSYPTAPKQLDNEGIDGQQFHYYTYTYNTNPKCISFFSLNCQLSDISPRQQSVQRKPL